MAGGILGYQGGLTGICVGCVFVGGISAAIDHYMIDSAEAQAAQENSNVDALQCTRCDRYNQLFQMGTQQGPYRDVRNDFQYYQYVGNNGYNVHRYQMNKLSTVCTVDEWCKYVQPLFK
eukprot:TRINITY_DN98049_c0_g1_i1.p2 TRINITY_DN98049_c0_g1~~TRINITY_DN98049_c0_g1_i1.p2  ORF type:complete len:132 (+),score=5.44 TRINITY_DN98049_c0_g1_i1:41-397(+)